MRLIRVTFVASALALSLTAIVSARVGWTPGTIPATGAPSPVPSVAEWTAASEVSVTKSSDYHCETKVVREWFRSVCVPYGSNILLAPTCKQANGDTCVTFIDPSGKGLKASIVQRLRRGQTYKLRFTWGPSNASYDLTIAVDAAGGAVAGF